MRTRGGGGILFIYRVRLPAGAESGFVLSRIHACAKNKQPEYEGGSFVGYWGGLGVVGSVGRAIMRFLWLGSVVDLRE